MNKKEYVKPKIKRIWDVKVSLMGSSIPCSIHIQSDYEQEGKLWDPADAD